MSLARDAFPRQAIANGAPDSLWFDPEFRAHYALDWTLQELRRFPGTGGDLVALGLSSPSIMNRGRSLVALKAWPVDHWPAGVSERLREIASSDGHEKNRTLAAEVLARVDRER